MPPFPEHLDLHKSRNVCRLAWSFPTFPGASGTGFLIGPRVVLTAAHNIFDPWHGGWASGLMAFFPDLPPIGNRGSEVADPWVSHADGSPGDAHSPDRGLSGYDLGVVALQQAVAGVPPLPVDSGAAGSDLNVAGYPNDPDFPAFVVGELYGGPTTATFPPFWQPFWQTRLFYPMRTLAGMSGGPVWAAGAGGAVAVGVHTSYDNRAGGMPDNLGSGLRVSPALKALIDHWLTKYQ
ncbi:MAG TPA: serine protease [Gemmataceae bacterium]|jgi:V8-like Glu-specific endopeptidase